MLFETLDQALDNIASRSFYESARISKSGEGYRVEDWFTGVEERISWSYSGGAEVGDVLESSRVQEPYESYETAAHIRYNLPLAVDTIEEGTPVGFTYAVVEDLNSELDDPAVGWMLIATVE